MAMQLKTLSEATPAEQMLEALYPLTGDDAVELALAIAACDFGSSSQFSASECVGRLPLPTELISHVGSVAGDSEHGGLAVAADIVLRSDDRDALVESLAGSGRRAASDWSSPDALNQAIIRIAGIRSGDTVLDPCCGSGGSLLAAGRAGANPDLAGIEVNSSLARRAALRLAGHRYGASSVIAGDFAALNLEEAGFRGKFDVAIADLPFGVTFRPEAHGIDWPLDILPKAFEWFLATKALWALRPGGRFAFVVPRSILSSDRDAPFRRYFFEQASVTHLVALPAGVLGRTTVPSAIIAGRQRSAGWQDYVELIALSRSGGAAEGSGISVHAAFDRADNYAQNASENDVYEVRGEWAIRPIGSLLEDPDDPLDLTGDLSWLEHGSLTTELETAFPAGTRKLGELGELLRGESRNARSTVRAYLADRHEHNQCIEITTNGEVRLWDSEQDSPAALLIRLTSSEYSPEFLTWFLESRFGVAQRGFLSTGTARPRLTPRHAQQIEVPIVSVDDQERLLRCVRDLKTKSLALANWSEEIDSSPLSALPIVGARLEAMNASTTDADNTLERLPFPLAAALRRAEVQQHLAMRHKAYLQFLEAASQFVAVVSWSILYRDEEIAENHQTDWKRGRTSTTTSFLTWITLGRSLAKVIRRLMNDGEGRERWSSLAGSSDRTLPELLTSKELFGVFEAASNHRNAWDGHVGEVPAHRLNGLIEEVQSLVAQLLAVFGDTWSRHRLVRAGEGRREDEYVQSFEILVGPVQPFAPLNEVLVADLVRNNELCLLSPSSRNPVPLLPLVRMHRQPEGDRGAAYFYSRVDDQGPRFITYHSDGEPEWRPGSDVAGLEQALRWLAS